MNDSSEPNDTGSPPETRGESSADEYRQQDRGSSEAYEKYFQGMDKSMRQKIALVSSYFPTRGRVADMGSGSGSGSHDLAGLYPTLKVVGVDVNPRSVAYSREKYRRDNLEYIVGDIADPVFEPDSLSGILNSSVLHHVTSFNDFSLSRVRDLFDHQVNELEPEGILAVRDFVIPAGPEEVVLEIPDDNGSADETNTPDQTVDTEALSTAALFEKFALEFRSSRFPGGGIAFERLEPDATMDRTTDGRVRFRTGFREAVEFVLRKDYRRDWDVEILEEYTYFTRAEFEAEYRRRGLRIVISRELWNPWIVRNRFEGHFRMLDGNRELELPPTNYLIVGQKAPRGGGVRLREEKILSEDEPAYLSLEHYRESESQKLWDLARRPGRVLDIIPWLDIDGDIALFGRQGYPRPILNTGRPLDEAYSSGYINEPISGVASGESHAERARDLLVSRTGIAPTAIADISRGLAYYPSPGGINERVDACFARLNDENAFAAAETSGSGFSTSGDIRLFSATQHLRACQVGGMFDARLELNIYDLLLRLNRSPGPWIGAELQVDEDGPAARRSSSSGNAFIEGVPADRRFVDFEELYLDRFGAEQILFTPTPRSGDFLRVRRSRFVEENAAGETIAAVDLEYVTARHWSERTISFLPYTRDGNGAFWIGLEERFLPAPALFSGRARLFTCPAWRLPFEIEGMSTAISFARDQLQNEFKAECARPTPLGGSYCPSPGLTPESVSPFAVAITPESLATANLFWVSLNELVANRNKLVDGHLLIALLRFMHAAS